MIPKNRFRKAERITSLVLINTIFTEGKMFFIFPFRVFWQPITNPGSETAQFGISVSKKFFKQAVKRNKVKRITREAIRIKKGVLLHELQHDNKQVALFLVYSHHIILPYKQVELSVDNIFTKLLNQISHLSN